MKLNESKAKNLVWLSSSLKTLELLDRILTNRNDITTFVDTSTDTAYACGPQIGFGTAMMALPSTCEGNLATAILLGVNYHEISHILFTPRHDSWLSRRCSKSVELRLAYNALEDQRIENLIIKRYPGTEPFLRLMLKHFILVSDALMSPGNTENEASTAHALIWGRKHVSKDIREEVKSQWCGSPEEATRLAEIIDEYIVCDIKKGTQTNAGMTAWELIKEYATIIVGRATGKASDLFPGNNVERSVQQEREVVPSSEELEKVAQDVNEERRADSGVSDHEEHPEENNNAGDSSESDNESGNEPDSEPDSESGNKPGNEPDSESGNKPGDESGSKSGSESGSKSDTASKGSDATPGSKPGSKSGTNPAIFNPLSHIADGDMDDVEVIEAIDKVRTSVHQSILKGNLPVIPVSTGNRGNIQPADRTMARSIYGALERILSERQPARETRQRRGRIDARRYYSNRDGDLDCRKQWVPGPQSNEGCEFVIALDCSSSMLFQSNELGRFIDQANSMAWAVKSALTALQMPCSVLTFGSESKVLYKATDSAKQKRIAHPDGMTDPTGAMLEAQRIFAISEMTSKVLITISDGGWSVKEAPEESVLRMRADGVSTFFFALEPSGYKPGTSQSLLELGGTHNHEVSKSITSMDAVTDLVRQIVTTVTLRSARNSLV